MTNLKFVVGLDIHSSIKHLFMESKIRVALDTDNQPIIKIEHQHSDDVRDDMVKRFLETFESRSPLCTSIFLGSAFIIRPIKPNDLVEVIDGTMNHAISTAKATIALLSSMIDGRENHSEKSKKAVDETLQMLTSVVGISKINTIA